MEGMNYTHSKNILVGPYGEIYPACYDANQAMNIKAEEVSDTEEEVDPLPITFMEIKAEPESTLNELQSVCGEQQPYCCDMSNKSFSHHSSPKKHQCIHSGERPFCCEVCGKNCVDEQALQQIWLKPYRKHNFRHVTSGNNYAES
ncbi:gastrula zinc finger protein XlCGF49.1-like isoform X2 [Cryptotermes secundus]|uniref:gastrula zinc finger protein XlCGF49.1-like isoform X2 n=1 Tax=Cryptotermes secundus TaxID=105785 RepID=UPI000CD7CB90|nr:gastrula zinc finger protein XlCGF49.1-like isoform X2 [Cryptotermes secundus]